MNAKDFLKQVYFAHQEVDVKLEQIARLQSLASRTTAVIKGVPSGSSFANSRIENVVVLIHEKVDQLSEDISKLMLISREVADAIASIDNPNERLVLECRYLNFLSWNAIAKFISLSVNHVFKIHNLALKKIVVPS